MQDTQVSFRANEALISVLHERARRAGCSVSEYLRSVLRQHAGLQ